MGNNKVVIDKPESKFLFPSPSPKSIRKGKEDFGLWAVSKILWATTHHPPPPHPIPPLTFKHEGGLNE